MEEDTISTAAITLDGLREIVATMTEAMQTRERIAELEHDSKMKTEYARTLAHIAEMVVDGKAVPLNCMHERVAVMIKGLKSDIEVDRSIVSEKNRVIDTLYKQREAASKCLEDIAKIINPNENFDWDRTVTATIDLVSAMKTHNDKLMIELERAHNEVRQLEAKQHMPEMALISNTPWILRQLIVALLQNHQPGSTITYLLGQPVKERAARLSIMSPAEDQYTIEVP